MVKHSAGIWKQEYDPVMCQHTVRTGLAGEKSITINYGRTIDRETAEADARLIEAAPQLLAIAREISRFQTIKHVDDKLDAILMRLSDIER